MELSNPDEWDYEQVFTLRRQFTNMQEQMVTMTTYIKQLEEQIQRDNNFGDWADSVLYCKGRPADEINNLPVHLPHTINQGEYILYSPCARL
jgi:hypothetical protein